MSTILEGIKAKMAELQRKISRMSGVGTPTGNGTGLIPNFKLPEDIRIRLEAIPGLVTEDHLDAAHNELTRIEEEFNSRRFFWLRQNLPAFEKEHVVNLGLDPSIKPQWIDPIRKKFKELQALLLGGGWVDADHAVEMLQEIITMSNEVKARGAEVQAWKENERFKRDRENLARHRERCQDVAREMRESLTAMFAAA